MTEFLNFSYFRSLVTLAHLLLWAFWSGSQYSPRAKDQGLKATLKIIEVAAFKTLFFSPIIGQQFWSNPKSPLFKSASALLLSLLALNSNGILEIDTARHSSQAEKYAPRFPCSWPKKNMVPVISNWTRWNRQYREINSYCHPSLDWLPPRNRIIRVQVNCKGLMVKC